MFFIPTIIISFFAFSVPAQCVVFPNFLATAQAEELENPSNADDEEENEENEEDEEDPEIVSISESGDMVRLKTLAMKILHSIKGEEEMVKAISILRRQNKKDIPEETM
ncbi:MAG: hypothetical protein LBI26_01540 [Holosporales bacterium]|nr:hypothetical protein [Holosporales bacterium]